MTGPTEDPTARHHNRRHDLAVAASTHLTRRQGGEDDDQARGDGRGDPEQGERSGGDGAHRAGYQGDERRLIRIAPRQMAPAGQEIQLIAVVSVAAADDDEETVTKAPTAMTGPRAKGGTAALARAGTEGEATTRDMGPIDAPSQSGIRGGDRWPFGLAWCVQEA